MHFFGTFDARALAPHPRYDGHADGYAEAELVNRDTGSVHTGLAICELAANGTLSPHVHSYEEGFYILSGRAKVAIDGRAFLLGPGDYGALKVGTPHGWRASGAEPVRWLQMAAPQPNPVGRDRDTFFPARATLPADARPLDAAATQEALVGHFDAGQIPSADEGRIAGGGLQGVFLRWLIDEKLGARHHRMLFIEYQPGVSIGLHDHTFEESYFILSGEVQATLDGRTYLARAGDVLWTGVGCVHAFANVGREPVRWLETFSPQPPAENVFRFVAEWEQRARELEGT
jgi:quercetin dioxygenase-like cupin family protein